MSMVVRFFSARWMLVIAMPPANNVNTAPSVNPAIQLPPGVFPYRRVSIPRKKTMNGQNKGLRKTYSVSDFSNKDSHDNHNKQSIGSSVRAKLDEEVEVSLTNDPSDPLNSKLDLA